MIEEISIKAAADTLERQGEAVYLDVRTVEEFERGHPLGAWNVPYALPSPVTGMMMPNPEFVRVVDAVLERDVTVLCGCATGMRSLHAGNLLSRVGFTHVLNVDAGFNGKRDPAGRLLVPGWEAAGLPIEAGDGGERGYGVALAAAGGASSERGARSQQA